MAACTCSSCSKCASTTPGAAEAETGAVAILLADRGRAHDHRRLAWQLSALRLRRCMNEPGLCVFHRLRPSGDFQHQLVADGGGEILEAARDDEEGAAAAD